MSHRRPSPLPTTPRRTVIAVLALVAACERRPQAPPRESAAPAASAAVDSAAVRRAKSGWNPELGPVLFVQGPSREEAVVLYPVADDSVAMAQLDSATVHQDPVTLFGRGGERLSGQLGTPNAETTDECERWPLRSVAATHGQAATWAVGFVNGRVSPLPLDSVSVLSPRDSMMLAAEVSRLASMVTAPTGPSFQGLRFSVHDIRRFQAAPGVDAVAAHVVRRVNQEASPQEEQTLLIAERDSGVTSGPYRLAYAERAFGREEEVVTPEILAGVRLRGTSQPMLLVARDGAQGIVYSLIERVSPGRWRVRWSSEVTRCG